VLTTVKRATELMPPGAGPARMDIIAPQTTSAKVRYNYLFYQILL